MYVRVYVCVCTDRPTKLTDLRLLDAANGNALAVQQPRFHERFHAMPDRVAPVQHCAQATLALILLHDFGLQLDAALDDTEQELRVAVSVAALASALPCGALLL